jgi:MYXO-CTERM domain-containing protein
MIDRRGLVVAALSSTALAGSALAGVGEDVEVTVTIESLAPMHGTYHTPFWVGFHDGSFDTFDMGSAASTGLQSLAEDGNAATIMDDFMMSGAGSTQGLIASGMGIPPFAPGEVGSMNFTINAANSQYFSFLSMVIPSNDAFVGNDDAMGISLFNGMGEFVGADFFITGAMVWDAGTEVNDELPENTAFLGQMAPNTGVDENGTVQPHMGYLGSAGAGGALGNILGSEDFTGADFTLDGYPIARITITQVPAPGALAMLGLAGIAAHRRRRLG